MSESASGHDSNAARERRRRLEEIFGDVLPEQVRDDVDSARNRPRTGEDWLREQVPPHHG